MDMHGRNCDEAHALRGLGVLVVDYLGVGHFAVLAEKVMQPRVLHLDRQIAY
jgi:hypothetical protein